MNDPQRCTKWLTLEWPTLIPSFQFVHSNTWQCTLREFDEHIDGFIMQRGESRTPKHAMYRALAAIRYARYSSEKEK